VFDHIPGAGRGAAEVILAEIGPDTSPFPTARHLLSWAGVVPRLDERAGKRRSARVHHGAPCSNPCSSNVPGLNRALVRNVRTYTAMLAYALSQNEKLFAFFSSSDLATGGGLHRCRRSKAALGERKRQHRAA
jgi:hypothetical protein